MIVGAIGFCSREQDEIKAKDQYRCLLMSAFV